MATLEQRLLENFFEHERYVAECRMRLAEAEQGRDHFVLTRLDEFKAMGVTDWSGKVDPTKASAKLTKLKEGS